jgi:glutamine amidotransferase-like uncharacterized protein
MKTIILYTGAGVSETYLPFVKKALKEVAKEKDAKVKLVREDFDFNLDNCILFVLPGGHALQLLASIPKQGWEKLNAFIDSGGKFLGICAGVLCVTKTFIFRGTTLTNPHSINKVQTSYGIDYKQQQITLGSGEKAYYDHSPTQIRDSRLVVIDTYNDKCIIATGSNCLFIGIHLEKINPEYFKKLVYDFLG